MSVSKIEDNEIQTGSNPFSINYARIPGAGTGQVVIVAAGDHPKCRLVGGQATALVYSTGVDVIAVEDAAGNDAATVSASATVFTPVPIVLGAYTTFEKDEAIVINVTTEGHATNSTMLTLNFVNVE